MADVLAFGAHPDDVEIGCGGTVALLASLGRSVVIVDFTRGESGTRGTVDERAAEAQAAAKALGAKERVNLELPDGFLPFSDAGTGRPNRDLAVERVVELIREHRPRLLLANFPSDAHPDHVVVGEVVKQARYLAGLDKWRPDARDAKRPRHRPDLVLHYFEHEHHEPTLLVDVSRVYAKKLEAIRCHRSQLHDPKRQELETALSRPDFLERREARDRFFGVRAGVQHAEPFFTTDPPRIADPMSLVS
jgi:bacillithiol biosynthesis deacetylase BshB1